MSRQPLDRHAASKTPRQRLDVLGLEPRHEAQTSVTDVHGTRLIHRNAALDVRKTVFVLVDRQHLHIAKGEFAAQQLLVQLFVHVLRQALLELFAQLRQLVARHRLRVEVWQLLNRFPRLQVRRLQLQTAQRTKVKIRLDNAGERLDDAKAAAVIRAPDAPGKANVVRVGKSQRKVKTVVPLHPSSRTFLMFTEGRQFKTIPPILPV